MTAEHASIRRRGASRECLRPADLVDLAPLVAPDKALQRKLVADNPARLYGFVGR